MDRDPGAPRVDFVLGDCHGAACDALVIDTTAEALAVQGYNVARNAPYSGGFVTRHYGRPGERIHALQIEINRSLYMDETKIRRGPHLPELAAHMRPVIAALGALDGALLNGA